MLDFDVVEPVTVPLPSSASTLDRFMLPVLVLDVGFSSSPSLAGTTAFRFPLDVELAKTVAVSSEGFSSSGCVEGEGSGREIGLAGLSLEGIGTQVWVSRRVKGAEHGVKGPSYAREYQSII